MPRSRSADARHWQVANARLQLEGGPPIGFYIARPVITSTAGAVTTGIDLLGS
jgi:hypothetical protein